MADFEREYRLACQEIDRVGKLTMQGLESGYTEVFTEAFIVILREDVPSIMTLINEALGMAYVDPLVRTTLNVLKSLN